MKAITRSSRTRLEAVNQFRIPVVTALLMSAGLVFTSVSAYAAEPFEGVWAETAEECLDKEGPNSRTLIDLANEIKGKASPLFDQYEHHCKVLKVTHEKDSVKLQLRCFEFWEDFTKKINGSDEEVVISSDPSPSVKFGGRNSINGGDGTVVLKPDPKQKMRIDGKTFVRCKD